MPVVKIRAHRQITIPKTLFDELDLQEGDFMEVSRKKDQIVVKRKKSIDAEDRLTPEEEKLVAQGFSDLQRGDYETWEQLKHDMDL